MGDGAALRLLGALASAFGWLACAQVETPRLERWDANSGYRVDLDRPDAEANRTFVILSFSGGGTRAAALSYGVLRALREDTLGENGPPLLDEVDVISSVSGGSFTAAFYALHGPKTFDAFEDRFLYVDIEGRLKRLLFNPVQWLRLMSPYFSRIDLAAEYYDEKVFDHGTYGDLAKAERRPYIVVNATSLATGDRFEFIQSQMDWLCIDLSRLPVARAVAASSAFPGLLSPITLRNRSGRCGFEEPQWIEQTFHPDAQGNPARRVDEAKRLRAFARGEQAKWVHLIDGGVADNIGLRGPLWSMSSLDPAWSVVQRMNLEETDRVVVIAVDAKTRKRNKLGKRRSTPGLISVLKSAASVPMDHYSFDTLELLTDYVDRANKDSALAAGCEGPELRCPPGAIFHQVEFYPVHVQFDDEKSPGLRDHLLNLETSFKLDAEDVALLIEAGAKLLRQDPTYQRLLKEWEHPDS